MADRTISYRFTGNFASLSAGLTAAGRSVGEFGNRLTALDRQGARMRSGLNDIGGAAGRLGLAAGVGLGAAIAVTAKFESAMSRVSAATNASASDLEALRKAAIKAGADTVFSASEAADGITELAKAGLSAKDILSGGLSGALNLAAAGQIGVADAAATTAITLQQFSLDGSQATRVADTLAASASKAVGDVGDMSQALQYVGPVAAQMGLSLEETTGAIAELASAGILGSQAGTSLRGMLTGLTSPSKAAKNQMDALGISMYDAQGKFVGIDGIAGQLKETMGGLTAADRDHALGVIFGNEQITAARILYSGGSADVEKWTKAVTDSGFAADQAAKLNDNLAGDIEQLKGSFETALIETGSGSQGPLRGLVQNLTDVVNGYSSLPGPAKSATSAALGVTAALGGGAFVFTKALSGLAGMQTSLMNMGVSAQRATTSVKILGRAGVGAAGLGLLAVGLASTDKKMAALSTTAGGAALGFSVAGPWGAAIGGAIGLVVGLGHSHDDAAKKVAALTGTFDQQTGAITDNTKALIAKQLQDDGLLDSAERLGISTQLVTDAVMGQADAQKQLNDALAGYGTDGDLFVSSKEQYDLGISDEARAKQQKIGEAVLALRDKVPQMGDDFATSAEKAKQLALALNGDQGVAGATAELTSAQAAGFQTGDEYVAAQKAAADALKEAHDAARDTATSFFNLGDSVNDAKVSLGDWIGSLEKQADALRNFRVNAKKAADEGLRGGLIRALQEAGPEGAMRLKQLASASEEEIGRANKAWKRGQDEIDRYTHAVGKVPTSATTNVNANVNGAIAALNGIQNYKLRDKFITVHTRNTGDPRTGHATGGYIAGPGSATSDSIPARLSNGEYVIQAKAVNRYGVAMFDSLNAQRFAKGGEVKKGRARRALGGLDVDLSVDAEGASDALGQFADDVDNVRGLFHDAGMKWTKSLNDQTDAIRKSARTYDALNGSLATARNDRAAFAGTVGSSLGGSVFGNGLAGFDAGVAANTADYTAANAGLSAAIAKGLDGPLLDALAASGDLNALTQFGALDAAGIAERERQYGAMQGASGTFGNTAAAAKYDASIATYVAEVKHLGQVIERLEKRLPGAVRDGARDGSHQGTRDGNKDRDTTTTQTTRTTGRGGGHRGNGK